MNVDPNNHLWCFFSFFYNTPICLLYIHDYIYVIILHITWKLETWSWSNLPNQIMIYEIKYKLIKKNIQHTQHEHALQNPTQNSFLTFKYNKIHKHAYILYQRSIYVYIHAYNSNILTYTYIYIYPSSTPSLYIT